MARPLRIDVPNMIYHVYSRGNNKAPIFVDDTDRNVFFKHLQRTHEKYPFSLYSHCLMGNHYHLELHTREETSLSALMHYQNSLYAGFFNHRYKMSGHLFQGRYHSIVVQNDRYALQLSRYIHLNPVKAGLAQKPEDYPWSSYGHFVQGGSHPLLDTSFILDYFQGDIAQQRKTYQKFVEDGAEEKPLYTNEENLRKTRILGSLDFYQHVLSLSNKTPK